MENSKLKSNGPRGMQTFHADKFERRPNFIDFSIRQFTHGLFMVVLILKFLILGTIYLYEKENDGESSGWKQMAPDPEKGEEDEIAE